MHMHRAYACMCIVHACINVCMRPMRTVRERNGEGNNVVVGVSGRVVRMRMCVRASEADAQKRTFLLLFFSRLGGQTKNQSTQVLVPYLLDGKPLDAALRKDDPCVDWRAPQKSGTCYYRCWLEGFRFLLRRAGLSKEKTKVCVPFLWLWLWWWCWGWCGWVNGGLEFQILFSPPFFFFCFFFSRFC